MTASADQPLLGVVKAEGGRQRVRCFAGNDASGSAEDADEALRAALAVIGAWSDLDWEEFSNDLDHIRHDSGPTPPVDSAADS